MGDRTAFFYGTLMAPEILHRVIYGTSHPSNTPHLVALAASLTITPAILQNHCRHRVRFADYPGIIPQANHSVRGTFVTGLTNLDIDRLDSFEGGEYTRVWVEVEVEIEGEKKEEGGHGVRKAETYVYTAGDDNLEMKEWDYEEFRKEKLKNWTGGSREYDEVDEFVAGLEDGEGNEEDEEDEEGKGQEMDGSFVVIDGDSKGDGR